jgi:ribA/ribD-fused uncharacterized protein
MEATKLNRKDFTFFWGGYFSQWAPTPFIIDGVLFNTAEQYMMYNKALMFGDFEIAKQIMETSSPKDQKALGRKVKGFDKDHWETYCRKIVYDANVAKAKQNEVVMEEYKRTRGTEIVEASPEDRIWGIGLHETDERILDRDQWDGTNWLGIAIMEARQTLVEEGLLARPDILGVNE